MYTFREIACCLKWFYLLFSLKYLIEVVPYRLLLYFFTAFILLLAPFLVDLIIKLYLLFGKKLQNTETKTMRVSWE